MKTFNFNVEISTNASISAEQAQKILDLLINIGLSDAQETLENDEGDVSMAQMATELNISSPQITLPETSVPVKRWDAYDVNGTVNTHQFDIEDLRKTRGQAFVTLGTLEGRIDDMMSVTFEITSNPLNGFDAVPCAHIHFNDDEVAMSIYKVGREILIRKDTSVSISPFVHKRSGFSERMHRVTSDFRVQE